MLTCTLDVLDQIHHRAQRHLTPSLWRDHRRNFSVCDPPLESGLADLQQAGGLRTCNGRADKGLQELSDRSQLSTQRGIHLRLNAAEPDKFLDGSSSVGSTSHLVHTST